MNKYWLILNEKLLVDLVKNEGLHTELLIVLAKKKGLNDKLLIDFDKNE